MYHVPESECFTAKYRAVLRGEEIKLFTPNDSISLYSQVNFDNQSLQKSAVDYFAVCILGGILSSVKAHFAQQRADIVEMEGYEADDVLRNIVSLWRKEKFRSYYFVRR